MRGERTETRHGLERRICAVGAGGKLCGEGAAPGAEVRGGMFCNNYRTRTKGNKRAAKAAKPP